MAWVYNPSRAGYETIVTVGGSRDLLLRNGVITFNDGGTDRRFGSAIGNNTWHHVAIVYDGTTLRAYLNGALRATPRAVVLGVAIGAVQIGASIYGSTNVDFFGGRIDEVRIQPGALTQAEIQNVMNTPLAP